MISKSTTVKHDNSGYSTIVFSGGSHRKDPTAGLPDLSRDELLAILDLIEKSGDSTPEARTVPPRYPQATTKPLYPTLPTDGPREPSAPTRQPPTGPVEDSSFHRSTPPTDISPVTPPNYPAPIAPPLPASTTPKPKKSFFDKLVGGVLKIVSPQTAGGATKASPGALLNNFLSQLQNAQQSNTQTRDTPPAASANVLNNLLQRLQGQNSEGSQFVTNLIQTLQGNNGPSTQRAQAGAPAPQGSAGELFSSLLKSVTQQGQQGQSSQTGQSGGLNFAELLQRELFNRNGGNSPATPDKKSTTDLLLDGFKQVLQQTGRQ